MVGKRTRSPPSAAATSDSAATASIPAKRAKTTVTAKKAKDATGDVKAASANPKISNGSLGKFVRSPEALESLRLKKSSEEIWEGVVPFARMTKDSDFDASKMYKLITWNVAGLRGVLKKDEATLKEFMAAEKPDILCLQETKLNVDDAAANAALGVVEGYSFVDHPCAFKKGYSGTRTYMRTASMVDPLHARCTRGFLLPSDTSAATTASAIPGATPVVEGVGDEEGRVLTTFLTPDAAAPGPRLAVVNTYVANSGMDLNRLPHRVETFDPLMRDYLMKLDAWSAMSTDSVGGGGGKKTEAQPHGFIWTGDLNVAERDFDRYYAGTYKTMQECSGFTPEERASFRKTLSATSSVDVFRRLYPDAGPAYTFWSMRINGRAKGLGWRLDYFIVSARLAPLVVDCFPMPEVVKSDHCPVQLWLRKP